MILFFWFILGSLFTWRAASMIAHERGAFMMFTGFRWCFGLESDEHGAPLRDDDGDLIHRSISAHSFVDTLAYEIAEGLVCVWCNSVWIGALVALLLIPWIVPVLTFSVQTFALTVGGLSAAAILIDSLVQFFTREE